MGDLFQNGINFFNDGRYFEAHEAWEDLWRSSTGPLRLYYQGLVQAAVGLHHLHRGNSQGARALLERSVKKLEQYPADFCRISNVELTRQLRETLTTLAPQHIRILQLK
jgi:predicted metal-dependent hydrolase